MVREQQDTWVPWEAMALVSGNSSEKFKFYQSNCVLRVTDGNMEDNLNIKNKTLSLKRELSACNDRGSLFSLFGVRGNLHQSLHWQSDDIQLRQADPLCLVTFFDMSVQKLCLQVFHMHAGRLSWRYLSFWFWVQSEMSDTVEKISFECQRWIFPLNVAPSFNRLWEWLQRWSRGWWVLFIKKRHKVKEVYLKSH